jgi:3-deoxy-manno-octulosonate cytidylyltransferase (CMP-KDO synthetase)
VAFSFIAPCIQAGKVNFHPVEAFDSGIGFMFACMRTIWVIIPARFASTRFPGKPLVDIAGKSMIMRVYEQAVKAFGDEQVIVATDDMRIADHVAAFGRFVMTPDCPSGTDRCALAAALEGITDPESVIINLQGDEPCIQPSQIQALAAVFESDGVQIASMMKPIHDQAFIENPNVVKVVTDNQKNALYFSRLPIPCLRDPQAADTVFYRHLGVYAFRADVLQVLAGLPQGKLEKAESLEQLRWLENGYRISMVCTDYHSPAVDTPEDLAHVENFLKSHPEFR